MVRRHIQKRKQAWPLKHAVIAGPAHENAVREKPDFSPDGVAAGRVMRVAPSKEKA